MNGNTPFTAIYDSFLTRCTSDMFMEMSEIDTLRQLQDILIAAIPRFHLPRFDVFDYEIGFFEDLGVYNGIESNYKDVPATGWVGGTFNSELTPEEINILGVCMLIEWFTQQLATTENTRMKYSGADFKFTSQANHMAKLNTLIETWCEQSHSLQDKYKRRRVVNGKIQSTLGMIMTKPTYGYKI